MSDSHGVTAENMMLELPEALRRDSNAAALAQAVSEQLAKRPSELERLLIYSRIDELPEALLDILAYDFKVDWWDGDYTLEQKRQILLDSWRVHRMLGTKAAVEMAISAIYPSTKALEWFEYDGEPYHFKLQIDATFQNISPERHQRVLDRVETYKNLRSHLDGVEYVAIPQGCGYIYTGAALAGYRATIVVEVRAYGVG